MKYKNCISLVMLSVLISLAGCSKNTGYEPSENSLYIKKDGSVQSVLIYDADESTDGISEDSLREFIQKELDEYNAMQPDKNAVSIESVEADGKGLSVIYNYASPYYIASWANYSQDDSINISGLEVDTESKTVTVNGEAVIYFEGSIEAASDGVSVDGKRVKTPNGTSSITYK